mmetsp:Transcript_7940/g.20163  ORF Transcript_7940/g.20163 Transcript_7940/m.20163 type:complete len:200 (-) Transcript_7940:624-1223(-)
MFPQRKYFVRHFAHRLVVLVVNPGAKWHGHRLDKLKPSLRGNSFQTPSLVLIIEHHKLDLTVTLKHGRNAGEESTEQGTCFFGTARSIPHREGEIPEHALAFCSCPVRELCGINAVHHLDMGVFLEMLQVIHRPSILGTHHRTAIQGGCDNVCISAAHRSSLAVETRERHRKGEVALSKQKNFTPHRHWEKAVRRSGGQ